MKLFALFTLKLLTRVHPYPPPPGLLVKETTRCKTTSEAVLTEVFHLVGDSRREMEADWKCVRSGALLVGTLEHAELTYLHGLMSRYWDRGFNRNMDFADATLVYLAKRESFSAILTVDQADFATYRIEGKRQFRVWPRRRA